MVERKVQKIALAPVVLGVCLLAMGVHAQTAGEVEFSRGVGFAQTGGETPRTLGKGLALKEGDRLTTSDGASAIIKMNDGTRMTVRPNSELVLSQFRYQENAPDNSMLMQLVRGGFRAVTGLIAKSSPNAARVQTSTATIGIRGTDFDARLCARDCGAESQRVSEAARPNAVLASAKVVQAAGELSATDGSGQRRRLVGGGSVYPGDVVETAPGTHAVLAFRDDTRVTLGAATRFRVDNFVYDDKNAGEGRFLASLLKGSVRALTGLIGKANNRNVGFSTATATIGIRGTALDISCTGECAGEPGGQGTGTTVAVRDGGVSVRGQGAACRPAAPGTPAGSDPCAQDQILIPGQALLIGAGLLSPLPQMPSFTEPTPESVPVPAKLFAGESVAETQEGLFVFVRDGHIEIASSAGEVLHLGRGEAGFSGPNGETARPNQIPKFLDFDRLPLPSSRNPMLVSVLAETGIRAANQCR